MDHSAFTKIDDLTFDNFLVGDQKEIEAQVGKKVDDKKEEKIFSNSTVDLKGCQKMIFDTPF